MIEFDVQQAIATTYSGLGAAFVVLAFLILFILAVRLAIAEWIPYARAS